MVYVIMCGGYYEHWKTPKQLQVVNGERIVERTIRILKELGVEDINISSNDKRFDELGVPRLEHNNSYRYEDIKDKNDEKSGTLKGYWLDAFYPNFPLDTKVTYLYGDVYYTEGALKTIVTYTENKKNMLFSTGGEPLAYRVNDYSTFLDGIKAVKKLQDEGKITREGGVAITWELYRYLNGIDINEHKLLPATHVKIKDGSIDADWTYRLETMEKRFRTLNNVFYSHQLGIAGGPPSFYKYLFKLNKDKDIVFIYKSANLEQLKELSKYVKVMKYHEGMKIKCKKIFFCHNTDIIDSVDAEEYIKVIHSDYKAVNLEPDIHPKITKYISVSEYTRKRFKELTGIDSEVCYNPLCLNKPNKRYRFISTSRLTEEKGPERIKTLVRLLDKSGIYYTWTIFSRNKVMLNEICSISPNIIGKDPIVDVTDEVYNSDFLIQLSSHETYCYSVIESLVLKTPVIVTKCPVFKELGLNSNNSIFLDFDFKELPKTFMNDLERLTNSLIDYTPPKDNWDKYLVPSKSSYVYDPNQTFETDYVYLKPKKNYYDSELKRNVRKTEQPFITTRTRAEELVAKDLGIIVVYKDKEKQNELLKFN